MKHLNKLYSHKIEYTINEQNIAELTEQPDENMNVNAVMEFIIDLIRAGASIEEHTCQTIAEKVHQEQNEVIDSDLATDLLSEVLLSEKPSIWFEVMRLSGVLEYILPELLEAYGCEQNEFHLYDVYYHLLNSCDNAVPMLDIRMGALFHDIGKPRSKRKKDTEGDTNNTFYGHEIIGARMFKKIMKRFDYDNEFVDKVGHLIRFHMFHYTDEWTNNAVRRFIRSVGEDLLKDLFLLREADRLGSGKKSDTCDEIEAFKERIEEIRVQDKAPKVTDLEISGNDIINRYDIKPGPIIGEILRYLLQKTVEDPELNERETLLKLLDQYYQNNISNK
jgi:poly(A) polymerase/tRNA nucleotidyltransferase (CCA-adding enzyme)